MPKPTAFAILLTVICLQVTSASAQKELDHYNLQELIYAVEKRSVSIEQKLTKQTEKFIARIIKQERRLLKKIGRYDSVVVMQWSASQKENDVLLTMNPAAISTKFYSGYWDSLSTALRFLGITSHQDLPFQGVLNRVSSLEERFQKAEMVKSILLERSKMLQESLQRFGLSRSVKLLQKQGYYFHQQLRAYKALWEHPSEIEQKLLKLLSETEAFKSFFLRHSQLASLFALPGGNTATASLAGLQTRASVQQTLQNRFGTGTQVQQMLQQNLQTAQGQFSALQNKLFPYSSGDFGNSNTDIDMPVGFKPNNQKTKSFSERLEYGANIQSQKASSYFPSTSDLGLSLGYKLNDNSTIGIGASYKIGWGRGWDHFRITSEGVGLRSYLDIKLKGSFYLSGGYEQNYRSSFENVQQLRDLRAWQQSGLLGLRKKYQLSKKLKGDIKLLWDFLSYQQVPRTQAMLFRVGYNLK